MFTPQLTMRRVPACITTVLVFVLLLNAFTLFFSVPSVSASLAQETSTATPAATASITPAVSVRCAGCITWPNSDQRLDVAHGDRADLDAARVDGLKDIPLVLSFGVADNATWLPGHLLRYNWDYSCRGSHSLPLAMDQVAFIKQYNPSFFDGAVLDSATQYRQFVTYLQTQNPNTLIGSYSSSTTCVDGPTNPFTENYYPSNAVDCHRLAPLSPGSMETQPFEAQYCKTEPAKWYINFADADIRARFAEILLRTVKETDPKPPFIFLDNTAYLDPEFLWKTGEKTVDCRERAAAQLADCSEYTALQKQFGRNIYFEDFIEQYRTLITGLEQVGVRSILNIGVAAGVLGYERDKAKYAQQFETVVEKNGLAFEFPFQINLRTNGSDTQHEIDLHRRLLQQGKLVVFYADYKSKNASSWMAAMAMLIREPGQSLFVARDAYSSTLEWIGWPALYGAPVITDTVHPVRIDSRKSVGENWFMSRQFEQNGITREITTAHFGVNLQNLKTFTLTLLVPNLDNTYEVVYDQPKLGNWDKTTKVYTATRTDPDGPGVQADYFILGAECSDEPRICKKLIAVSVAVWR
ncbi:MAG: hypothetical protein DYG89_47980 [Caldilinea sp. CFX5]|nr:hypothetical protein [Caldilinea sp. CFX5]